MSIYTDGIPTEQELNQIGPSPEILAKGPKAILECFQKIPCDPCAAGCPTGAIRPFEDLNDLPVVDYTRCTGCGLCIASCPGLAIFVIDLNFLPGKALIKIPYELLPLPIKNQIVLGLNREGKVLTKAKVIQVVRRKNKTNIISIIVPKDFAMDIRSIKVEDNNG